MMTASVALTLTQRCGLSGGDIAGADTIALDVVTAELRADIDDLALVSGDHVGQNADALGGIYKWGNQIPNNSL